MGRDIANKKLDVVNMKFNGTDNSSPKSSGESASIRKLAGDEVSQVETIGFRISNHPMEKTPKSCEKVIISSPVSPASASASHEENVNAGLHISSNTNSFRSPINAKLSQSSPFSAPRAHLNKYHDEDDNWSLVSSAATSRTMKSRVTVGVAPSFRSAQRAAQRKEFYTKLEQKHQALMAEKMEYEARTKEEQEEAIKQLRKSMVVKANPVPSFYRQGLPPKAELKKLPLTRAKSPNLTRRKSCGDAAHQTIKENALCSKVRHSLGNYKPIGSTASSQIKHTQSRNINGLSKPKERLIKPGNETPKISHLKAFK